MRRQLMNLAIAVVVVSFLPAVAARAAGEPTKEGYSSEQQKESAADKIEDAATATAEAAKDAAHAASKELGDSWITLKIKLGLLADDRVSSTYVHVNTHRGVTTLRGKVGSDVARQAAQEDSAKIDGVKRVENHLEVVPKATREVVERKDDQIVKDVERRIKKDSGLKQAEIEVHADNGIVTLRGESPSLETSVRASEDAYRVPGVRAVRNELVVEKRQG
ncbi:MAG TPA: BON domain-containing protein [Candidatus Acidoferrum sp.]|nr:BON domain-containing protein [Candidatus Acidoferrum sp.]